MINSLIRIKQIILLNSIVKKNEKKKIVLILRFVSFSFIDSVEVLNRTKCY